MKRLLAPAAVIGVFFVAGCGDSGDPTTGTGTGSSGATSSASGSGGGSSTGTGGAGGATSTGTGSGGSHPSCTTRWDVKGSIDTAAIDRTFCNPGGQSTKGPGWVVNNLYFNAGLAPDTTLVDVLWGDEVYSATAAATAGIFELPASGSTPPLRVCLGAITRMANSFSATSLSTLASCPGQPSTDTLTASSDFMSGGTITGKINGAAVNGVITASGCYGTSCSMELKSGGIVIVHLDGTSVPQAGTSATVLEAYVRIPANAPAVTLLCGSPQSVYTAGSDGVFSLVLKGLTSMGTCPGAPVLGDITVTDLMP
jgi:hypothetical protein